MLLSYRIKNHKGCASISETLCELDEKLGKYTKALYNKKVYMSKMPIDKRAIRDLVIYKHILQNLALNPKYT